MSSLDEMLQEMLERIEVEDPLAVDTETTGFSVGSGDDVCIGVSLAQGDRSLYVPLAHEVGENADEVTYRLLKVVLEHHEGPLVFANAVFDILALETQGIHVEQRDLADVILMAHMIDENQPMSKSLDSLAKHYLGEEFGKAESEFIHAEKISGWHNTTWQAMWEYAVVDADLTMMVYDELRPRYEKELPPGLWDHKQDLMRLLVAMRRYGVRVDHALAREHVETAQAQMAAQKEVLGLTGKKDTVGPLFLNRVLHEELGIPVLKRSTKTDKPSFDKEAMALYEPYIERSEHPVGEALKIYRGWQKASSAATAPYLRLVESDGRLRCSYKMHGTHTGRLSCSDPNLQQIPKEGTKPWNGTLKECFIPEDGYTLINADFSQLELRLGAAYAGEEGLKAVFEEGRDIFDEMTADLAPLMPDDWVRFKTKTLVYSMQYGAGLNRIMGAFGVSKDVAQEIRSAYFRTYPKFRLMADQAAQQVERTGKIRLWSGRYRHFQHRNDSYKAWNSLIQGGAADIVERVMVRAFKTLHSDSSRILLQVHDSLTWEVRNDQVDKMMPMIEDVMSDVTAATGMEFGVRFAVDVGFWTKREEQRYDCYARAA